MFIKMYDTHAINLNKNFHNQTNIFCEDHWD